MTIGEKLDKELLENIKGNRLSRDKQNNFNHDSYKLFKPYYEGYKSFRDDAIDMAIGLHEKELEVTFVTLDIQEFYYNIEFDFTSDLYDFEDEYKLNHFMQNIHDKFHKIIEKNKLQPRLDHNYTVKKFLPIGLVSSSIIANHILNDLDKYIMQDVKLKYYGRYVDDMILVVSDSDIDIYSDTILCDLVKSKITCLKERDDSNYFTTNKRTFKMQKDKVKILQFEKDDSIIVLEKFKETIDKNSSFFKFMPDDKKLFKTLESSGNVLFYSDSENKISSLIGTEKDTLKISRNLSSVISTVSSVNFDENHFDDYNEQLKNVFSGKNIFELRLHWEKVFEYLIIIQNEVLFEKMIINFFKSIGKLAHKNQSERLISDTKIYLKNCIKFAMASRDIKIIDSLNKKLLSLNIDILENISKDIKSIRECNMFSHHNMCYPLLNFCKDIKDIDFLTSNIEFKNFQFEIDKTKRDYSPRFFHYHEIVLFYFVKMINDKFLTTTEANNYKYHYLDFINDKYQEFNHFKDKPSNFPRIQKDYLNTFIINSDEKGYNKEKLKISIVSIKVQLNDIFTSYLDTPNLSYERLQSLFDILNESIKKDTLKPDIIIFPEVSIPYAFIHFFARFSKTNNIGIVFGVEHIKIDKLVSNYTCVMLPFQIDGHINLFIDFDLKKHYSPQEQMGIEDEGLFVNENDKNQPMIYKWRGCVFATFNCFELSDITLRSNLVGKVDFIIAHEYNSDTNYFSNVIESLSRDIHCYVIQVNTSNYGDSRILQPTKTERKDIVKIKGGQNLYLVTDDINIKSLRELQSKNHSLQMQEKDSFKLTPPKFKVDKLRILK